MAAVLYVALLVLGWAVTTVVLDRDAIGPDVATIVGPSGAVAATVVVLFASGAARPAASGARGVIAGLVVLVAMPTVQGVVLFLTGALPGVAGVFMASHVLDPFVIVAAVLAGIVVVLAGLVRRAD